MILTESDIAILTLKQLRRQLTEAERVQLEQWIQSSEINKKKYLELTDFYAIQLKRKHYLEAEQRAEQFRLPELTADQTFSKADRRHFIFNRRGWLVAASIIALLGFGLYFYIIINRQTPPVDVTSSNDMSAPATNRAMITLADGSRIYLDSVDNGQLAQMGNIKLVKFANGQIAYQTVDGHPDSYQDLKKLQYNTLTNPRGSKVINMQLSDGSRIWLNAGSSITYPVAFVGTERNVQLNGEAYLEVTHDDKQLFIVKAENEEIIDLGTRFNVNAYTDEAGVATTLVEGRVQINNHILKPGQQHINNEAPMLKIFFTHRGM